MACDSEIANDHHGLAAAQTGHVWRKSLVRATFGADRQDLLGDEERLSFELSWNGADQRSSTAGQRRSAFPPPSGSGRIEPGSRACP